MSVLHEKIFLYVSGLRLKMSVRCSYRRWRICGKDVIEHYQKSSKKTDEHDKFVNQMQIFENRTVLENVRTGSTSCNASQMRGAGHQIRIICIVQSIIWAEPVAIWINFFRCTATYTTTNTLQLDHMWLTDRENCKQQWSHSYHKILLKRTSCSLLVYCYSASFPKITLDSLLYVTYHEHSTTF